MHPATRRVRGRTLPHCASILLGLLLAGAACAPSPTDRGPRPAADTPTAGDTDGLGDPGANSDATGAGDEGGGTLALGELCSGGGECASGSCACADAQCSERRCDEGWCEPCYFAPPGGLGRCDGNFLAEGVIDPRWDCGGMGCDGAGDCRGRTGLPCLDPWDCQTGVCKHGYCCELDCPGDCLRCDVPGLEGQCTSDDSACTGDCAVCGGGGRCTAAPERCTGECTSAASAAAPRR